MGTTTRRVASILLATGIATMAVGVGSANAEPAGYWQEQAELLPSTTSDVGFPSFPIQIDDATTTHENGVGVTRVTPYLAPWAHDLVPIDPNAVVDLTGAITLSAPGVVVEITGHCIFAGEATADADTHRVPSPVLDVSGGGNGLRISPRLYVR